MTQGPEVSLGLGHHRCHRVVVGRVGHECEGTPTGLADPRRRSLQGIALPIPPPAPVTSATDDSRLNIDRDTETSTWLGTSYNQRLSSAVNASVERRGQASAQCGPERRTIVGMCQADERGGPLVRG